MKQVWILICSLFAVTIAAGQFGLRIHAESDDIDKIEAALYGLRQVLPPGARIGYNAPYTSNETGYQVKYVLTPAYVCRAANNYDTVIHIYPLAMADSLTAALSIAHKIIWQNKDNQNAFLLTCRK
ncbi:MAG: hypothetical protein H7257_11710 [Taibaiella sp.]|nr:hypothetical protein [Taibaiella sp.]